MTKPISPDDIGKLKATRFPPQVFDAFNATIAKHWDGKHATFTQDEVLALILARMPEVECHHVFESRWLDVEDSYRQHGWHVEYDKPGFNESGPATFTFKRPTRG